MSILPIVHVTVNITDNTYTITDQYGITYDTFEFENGVQYVLNCSEDIYLTWKNSTTHNDVISDSTVTTNIDMYDLTTHEHHEYASDNLIYFKFNCPIQNDLYSRIGYLNNRIDNSTIEPDRVIDTIINDRILDYNEYLVNSTQEELLNILPSDYTASSLLQLPFELTNPNTTVVWEDDGLYVGVIANDVRLSPENYRLQWKNNSDFNRISMKDSVNGKIRVKTDLMHFAEGNGSNTVILTMRPGDEREFYINNSERSNNDLIVRGRQPLNNQMEIRQLFDDWLLDKYPEIYDVLLTYVRSQDIRNEPQAFLNNLLEYKDIDTTTDEIVKKLLRNIFTPFETVLADRRLLFKRLTDFLSNKGNSLSYAWLANVLFRKTASIRYYSDQVFRLDAADWREHQQFRLSDADISAINTESNRIILQSGGITDDDVAQSLIGFTVVGRKSKVVGVIETVEREEFNSAIMYLVSVSVKSGTFDQNEKFDITGTTFTININSVTDTEHEIGIVGYSISNAGQKYFEGQRVLSTSTTGSGFDASISSVDSNGAIKAIRIDDAGWFYRDYQDLELYVENDFTYDAIPYDVSLQFNQHESVSQPYIVFAPDIIAITSTTTGLGEAFDINGTNIILPAVPSCMAAVESNGVYFYLIPSTNGITVIDRFGNSVDYEGLANPSAILGMAVHNRNILIAYSDRYRIILFDELVSDKLVPQYIEVMYDGAQTGTVTGCMMYLHDIVIFTDDPAMWRYDRNVYSQTVTTPSAFIGGRVTEYNGIVSYSFYDGTDSWVQQSWVGRERAFIVPEFGRVNRVVKYSNYIDRKNSLSSFSKIQDNDLYQTHSFGIVLDESTDKYITTFSDMLLPTGYKTRGAYDNEVGAVDYRTINTQSIE